MLQDCPRVKTGYASCSRALWRFGGAELNGRAHAHVIASRECYMACTYIQNHGTSCNELKRKINFGKCVD